MIFNVASGGGSAAAGSWRFTTATARPDAVAKRTMLAICATAPTTITVSDREPASPAANDVWFHISNPEDGRAMSDGSVPIKCWGAYQYVSSAWTLLTAYYSFLGVWYDLPGLPPVGTALADCSWDQINRIGAAGKAADYFCVGDEKDITLSTSEVITLQIIGFAHDDLSGAGGGKAQITFCFKNSMDTKQGMNATNTNVNGYSGSALYSTINGSIYGSLPADLRAAMKNVSKLTSAGNQSATIVTTQENLFMLSEVEVFGSITYAKSGEGTQYAFFTNGGTRVKNVSDVATHWWVRSPQATNATSFSTVNASGTTNYNTASSLMGVALALCV